MRGFLGFGAALVIVPTLSFALPPVVAVTILVIIEIPTILYLVPTSIRDSNLRTVTPMLIGILMAVPVGTAVLIGVDPAKMKLAISVVLLMTVALLASGWRVKGSVGQGVMLGSGMIGGFVQGAAGMGGPPLVTALMSLPDTASTTRGNIVIALSSMSLFNFIALFAYGQITADILMFGAISSPVYVLSNYLGARFFRQQGNEHFRRAALIALASIALLTIFTSLT
jgi:uncharacterized membrane protein YfcA